MGTPSANRIIGVVIVFLLAVYAVPVGINAFVVSDTPERTDNFVASGTGDQEFTLTKTPVIAASETVVVGATTLTDSEYTLVDLTGVLSIATPYIDDLDSVAVTYRYQVAWPAAVEGFWTLLPILVIIGIVLGIYKFAQGRRKGGV